MFKLLQSLQNVAVRRRQAPFITYERLCHKEVTGYLSSAEIIVLAALRADFGLRYIPNSRVLITQKGHRKSQIDTVKREILHRMLHGVARPDDDARFERLVEERKLREATNVIRRRRPPGRFGRLMSGRIFPYSI